MKMVCRRLCLITSNGGAGNLPVTPAVNDNDPECLAFLTTGQGVVGDAPLGLLARSPKKQIGGERYRRIASFAAKCLYSLI
jgi:hypothetical protein